MEILKFWKHVSPRIIQSCVSLNFYKCNFRLKSFLMAFGCLPDVSKFPLEWYLSAGQWQRGQQSTSSSQNQHVTILQSTEKQPPQPATVTTVDSISTHSWRSQYWPLILYPYNMLPKKDTYTKNYLFLSGSTVYLNKVTVNLSKWCI